MKHAAALIVFGLVVVFLAPAALQAADQPADQAADAPPLTLAAMGKMRLARKTNAQIIEAAKQRGLAFEVDKKVEARLRAMRFKKDQIELLAKIADGRWAAEQKKLQEQRAAFDAAKPKAMKPGSAPEGVRLGPRMSDAWHDTVAGRTKRIHANAKTTTKIYPQRTVTVVISEASAKIHLPNVKKIEAALAKRFDEPIRTGTDKRSATIVLLDNRYEYESWVKTMFAVYEKDGIKWNGRDPLQMALKGPAFLTPTMTVADLSAMQEQPRIHHPVFCVGYLYMTQLTERQAPDALVNGFGNECEVMLFNRPMVRLNSYADREIGGVDAGWAQIVRNLLGKGDLASIPKVFKYSTASMEPHEYCQAWSLTQFLAQDPAYFARLIVGLRDQQQKKQTSIQVLTDVYQKTADELGKLWHAFISK